MSESASFLESWSRFFGELQSWLRSVDHTTHYPGTDFGEYVVNKLEMWINSVSRLVHHLENEAICPVIEENCARMNKLLNHLRRLLGEWNDRISDEESRERFILFCPP